MQQGRWPERLFLIHPVSGYLVPYSPDTSCTCGFVQTEDEFLPLWRVCALHKQPRSVISKGPAVGSSFKCSSA